MEYKLVICRNDFVLEEKVNELLKEGWKCQGGMNFYYYQKISQFAQAMVK